jgi:hypothetical protein
MSKDPNAVVLEGEVGLPEGQDVATSEKRGTVFDHRDMNRMGKAPQLRVELPFPSLRS